MMKASTPIKLTFYNPQDGEVKEEFQTYIIPWGMLKRALRFSKMLGANGGIDIANFGPEDLEELSGLVVDVFGGRFSTEDLDKYTDVSEMMTVLQSVIARSGATISNFTQPKE